jgi:hypothetical protein
LWGLKLIRPLRKRIQNYANKIRYEREYFSKMRTQVTTNYKFTKADRYHKRHRIRKKNNIFIN